MAIIASNSEQACSNSNLEWALRYAKHGWLVGPVKNDKQPLTAHGKNDFTTDEETITLWWRRWPDALVAIRRPGCVAIDCDLANAEHKMEEGVNGVDNFNRLGVENGYFKAKMPIQQTAGGGAHYIFELANGDINECFIAPGVHVRPMDKFYIIAEPSQRNGARYSWYEDYSLLNIQPPPLPDWIYELAGKPKAQSGSKGGVVYVDDSEWNQRRFVNYLATAPIAIEGQGGDRQTYVVPLEGHDLGLTEDCCFALLLEHYNPRCQPPWSESDLREKVRNGYRYAQNAQGSKNEAVRFAPVAPSAAVAPKIKIPAEGFPRSQAGNAMRLASMYGHRMRWCKTMRDFLMWDETRWERDSTERPKAYALEVVKELVLSAVGADELKFAANSSTSAAVAGMLELAKPDIPITVKELDQNPYLLNCNNGTIDFEHGGKLQPHTPEDYITKLIGIDYDPEASAPRWGQFLTEVFAGSEPMIEFVQRAVGSALIGSVFEHKLFILQGSGRNGKGTFINAIHDALGDYAYEIDPTLLTTQQKQGPNESLANLRGRRFVTTSETQDGDWLNEAMVKRLTGGDLITANAKHQHEITFLPSHTLFMVTNFEPKIKSQGCAIWARLLKIPFNACFLGKEDLKLAEALRAERAGIFAWLVQGCLKWQESGLAVPDEVEKATNAYKNAQDALAGFIDDRCILSAAGETPAAELRAAYDTWCSKNNIPRDNALNKNEFPTRMGEKFEFKKANSGKVWIGIALKPEGANDEKVSAKIAPPAPKPSLRDFI